MFDSFDAFEPFLENMIWTQKKAPKTVATVQGCVFHGRKEIESYQSMSGVIKRYSDTWGVTFPISETYAAKFAMGDTLKRLSGAKETLTVQSVIKEDGEWIVSVTSSTKLTV